jgi:hypothetical protein
LGDHPDDKERDKWLEQQARDAEKRARAALEENPDSTDVGRRFTDLAAEYRSIKGLSYDVLHEQSVKELMGDASAAAIGFAGARTPTMLRQSLETTKLEVEARNRITGVQNQQFRARASEDFFDGTKYSDKVKLQMRQGDFHGFPESVEAFQRYGEVTTIIGGDGKIRQKLEIPGSYRGMPGKFEFIKESDGTINHRFFRPD